MLFDKEDRARRDEQLAVVKETAEALDTLADIILDSDAPEDLKVGLRVLRAQSLLTGEIRDMIAPYVVEGNDPEAKKQIYEYLEMVRAGVQTFKKSLENKGEIQ